MTLQTTIDNILTDYPVAGVDNDSQGFRDNFTYISDALTIANSEIITLQTEAVLKGGSVTTVVTSTTGTFITVNSTVGFSVDMPVKFNADITPTIVAGNTYYVKSVNTGAVLTVASTVGGEAITVDTLTDLVLSITGLAGGGVDNDLLGSSINNGFYNNFHGVSYVPTTVISQTDIDVTKGKLQKFTLGASGIAFTFSNWPEDGKYAEVRVHLLSDTNGTYSLTLHSEGGGTIVAESGVPNPFTVSSTGKHKVIDAWSYNNGATVYVKYLGEF